MESLPSQKKIIVLGSTGSIGRQTLDVVAQHPDRLKVVGLSTYQNVSLLFDQAREFNVNALVIGSENITLDHYSDIAQWCEKEPSGFFGQGLGAISELIDQSDADLVVNALVGAAGLRASYETLKSGKVLALANKESLVVGGDLIMPLVGGSSVGPHTSGHLLPIDSEHAAIFQCLVGEPIDEVTKLWVTASGGPFRGWTLDQLKSVTASQALAHPTWNMGPKITIDSSTLMNKGLEVIEAHHLFAMDYDKIAVVVQPQSAIHSLVEFKDGSVKAHLGTTDMRIPIQYALSFPERWDAPVAPLDFRTLGALEFAAPDTKTFKCLDLAIVAGKTGGTLPCVMNAANEIAVAAFLDDNLGYLGIPACIEAVMELHNPEPVESIEQLELVDQWARQTARLWIESQ